jgi:hypothetical protein
MKTENLSIVFGEAETFNYCHPQEAKFFQEPYSELEVLELQNIFLNKGFHAITVPNLVTARKLIAVFLTALYYYHSPGYFSKSTVAVDGAVNIFHASQHQNAENFFYENPGIDFLWIEIPLNNNDTTACTNFLKSCAKLQLERQMPVVTLYLACNL